MEFNSRGFDTPRQYRYVFPTPSLSSSSNVPYFSDQAMFHRLWNGRSVGPVDMRPEVPIGVGFPSPVMLRQPLHQFEPGMLVHVEPFASDEVTVAMSVQERYGGRGYYHRDIGEFEAVPFRRLPPSPEMKMVIRYQPEDFEKEIVVVGNPAGATVSGSKRKAPPPPVTGSSGFFSNNSKKILEEWRCAVCDISATCERGLNEHLRGKKHLAQMESLKGHNTGADNALRLIRNDVKKPTPEIKNYSIGLGITNNAVKKQTSEVKSVSIVSKKVKMGKDFKFWCKMCQIGAHDEKMMSEHKKGKKHIKNRRKKARAKKRILVKK